LFLSIITLAALAELASPNDAYRAAIQTMRTLPVPSYVAYRADLDGGDGTISLTNLQDGRIKPRIVLGAGYYPQSSFDVTYRASDGLAAIAVDPDHRAYSNLALFDPTWNGVSLWLRRGLLATIDRAGATPGPNASATPAKVPTTILTVYAFDPNAYRVEDAGVGWCGSDPGRMLHLSATRDVLRHPLQRIVIDAIDGRVCLARFAVSGSEGPAQFDGYVELQLGLVSGYEMVTDGYVDVGVRQAGERVGFAHVRFHYRDVHTPVALPDDIFTQP
jgi:hypothetical protein